MSEVATGEEKSRGGRLKRKAAQIAHDRRVAQILQNQWQRSGGAQSSRKPAQCPFLAQALERASLPDEQKRAILPALMALEPYITGTPDDLVPVSAKQNEHEVARSKQSVRGEQYMQLKFNLNNSPASSEDEQDKEQSGRVQKKQRSKCGGQAASPSVPPQPPSPDDSDWIPVISTEIIAGLLASYSGFREVTSNMEFLNQMVVEAENKFKDTKGFLISELVVLAANVIVEMGLHNLEPKREPDRQGASGGKPSRTSSDESDEDD